jgi:hypothetical protein
MSDIFREVDEDVRRDEAVKFWEKYQTHLIVAGVIVALAAGGYRLYDNWRIKQEEAAGAKYETALTLSRDSKGAEAEKALTDIAATGTAGYRALAALRLAGETAKRDPAAGLKAFDALSSDPQIDPLLQTLARLRAAMLAVDTADFKETARRLEPLAAAGAPFRHSARELLGLAALKANDYATAGKWLDQIVTDAEAPEALHTRAQALLGLVQAGLAKPDAGAPAKQAQ